MPRYLGVHKLKAGMSDSDIRAGWEKYCESCEAAGLRPVSVTYSVEKGFAYCQTDAESSEQVRKAHEVVTIPLEDVIEVQVLD